MPLYFTLFGPMEAVVQKCISDVAKAHEIYRQLNQMWEMECESSLDKEKEGNLEGVKERKSKISTNSPKGTDKKATQDDKK